MLREPLRFSGAVLIVGRCLEDDVEDDVEDDAEDDVDDVDLVLGVRRGRGIAGITGTVGMGDGVK